MYVKKHLFCIVYTCILLLATVLSLLTTFIFSVNYETQGILGLEQKIPTYEKGKVTVNENSYNDNNISITISGLTLLYFSNHSGGGNGVDIETD